MKNIIMLGMSLCLLCLSSKNAHSSILDEYHLIDEKLNVPMAKPFDECTVSISGYVTMPGVGRIPMAFTVSSESCDDAVQEMRQTVIKYQFRISH